MCHVLCCVQCLIKVHSPPPSFQNAQMSPAQRKQCICPSCFCIFSSPNKKEVGASISFDIENRELPRAPLVLSWRTEPKLPTMRWSENTAGDNCVLASLLLCLLKKYVLSYLAAVTLLGPAFTYVKPLLFGCLTLHVSTRL